MTTKKTSAEEVTEVSSTDNETIWEELCRYGTVHLSNENSTFLRALATEQYPPKFTIARGDHEFIKHIKTLDDSNGIEEVWTLLGTDGRQQQTSTRTTPGRGTYNWMHSATTDKYLALLIKRNTQQNMHIIPELISGIGSELAKNRKKTTAHHTPYAIRHTPYAKTIANGQFLQFC